VATKTPAKDSANVPGGIKLIVGLGNPGSKYDKTRHNAGFWFLDELARQYHGTFQAEKKLSADVAKVNVDSQPVWLQKPQTFMNLSGRAVQQISTFYKFKPGQILVAHDEIDLPVGKMKLKRAGGHGGHNGLRDIISHLGKDFWRLRIGVDHPGKKDDVIDYVLKKPGKSERQEIDAGIESALRLAPDFAAGEMERAMHELHSQ